MSTGGKGEDQEVVVPWRGQSPSQGLTGGASAEGLCGNAHRNSRKRIERKRRVEGGCCYMAVVITFSSGSTVFS